MIDKKTITMIKMVSRTRSEAEGPAKRLVGNIILS